jgi:Integrase zinc binding domain/RNase H-like domain found in reverse transcriptase
MGVVFGLRKFRHLLYGEEFSVVTDHDALIWLMSLSDPKDRLARWVIEVQMFAFSVEYSPGGGELMAVPDALYRDTMEHDLVFCGRCMEIVSAVDEAGDKVPGGLQEAQVLEAQRAQFGDLQLYIEANDAFLLGADGLLYRVMDSDDIWLVIPDSLCQQVLRHVHGSRAVGHWGVLRTSARLRQRYWWHGWKKDVEKSVASCLACSLTRQTRARRQANMKNWHPRARFDTVAADVTDISPTSSSGCSKVAVIGYLFTRFMVAVPVRDEKAETIAEVLFERWIAIFGPPLRLLSDRGKPFVSSMVKYFYAKVGTEKIETAPYHPQSDGCVERFNRTLCNDLAKNVLDEANWDTHVTFAAFRYNSSMNSATGVTPYRAMFGVDVFEFDVGLGLQLRLEE